MTGNVVDTSGFARISSFLLRDFPRDPYRIAYLRGGSREVLKLRLFEFTQMGYLIVYEHGIAGRSGHHLGVAPDAPDRRSLPLPDRRLLTFFESPRSSREIFAMPYPPELLAACREYRRELERLGLRKGFVASENQFLKIAKIGLALILFASIALVLPLGPQVPLFVLALIAAGGLLLLFFGVTARPSRKGREYLGWLAKRHTDHARLDRETWALKPPAKQLALVGICGLGVLDGTEADALAAVLGKRYADDSIYKAHEYMHSCASACHGV